MSCTIVIDRNLERIKVGDFVEPRCSPISMGGPEGTPHYRGGKILVVGWAMMTIRLYRNGKRGTTTTDDYAAWRKITREEFDSRFVGLGLEPPYQPET